MAVRYTNFSLFFDLECGFLCKQYDENLNPDKVTVYPKTKKPIRKLIGFKTVVGDEGFEPPTLSV